MTTSVPFSVHLAHVNGCALVVVRGEVDMDTSPELASVLSGVDAADIVVDMSACEFIDSSGLGVLLGASQTARSLVLRSPKPIVKRAIDIVGLGDALSVEEPEGVDADHR